MNHDSLVSFYIKYSYNGDGYGVIIMKPKILRQAKRQEWRKLLSFIIIVIKLIYHFYPFFLPISPHSHHSFSTTYFYT